MNYLRGTVHFADLGYGQKPFLVVSNNRRNKALGSALAVRVTTTVKPALASVIPLRQGDPLVGSVMCDDMATLFAGDSLRQVGALSPATMNAVDSGLKVALGL